MKGTRFYFIRFVLLCCLTIWQPFKASCQTAAALNEKSERIINENPEEALQLAQQALEKAQLSDDVLQQSYALFNVGTAYYYLDKYYEAVQELEKGLKLAQEKKDKTLEGKCAGMIGEVYVYTAEYSKSIKYLSRAREIFEETGNRTEMARCNNNMGIIHKNQYNLNEALSYFQKAYEMGDDIRKGDASLYMGQVYISQKKYTNADKILQKAVELALKNNDQYVLADAYTGLGKVNFAFGQKEEALKYLGEALKIKEAVDDQQGIAIVCNTLGNLFLQYGQSDTAHGLFLRSAEIAAKIDTREELKDAFLGLSNTYHFKGIDDSAYLFLDRYNRINEEILSEEASKKLSQIEESLAAERRKQEEAHKQFQNKVYIGIGISIIIVLVIFVYIMYNRNKLKQRANEEIMRQKEEVERQKVYLEEQKSIIEEKNHEITDSINYARRIQFAVLPSEQDFTKIFNDSFVLFKPKDIVSGDFYWITKAKASNNLRRQAETRGHTETATEDEKELVVYATADCTGHGVPGGFMSMLGTSLLNEIVNERKIHDPAQVLDMLREKVIAGLKQTGVTGENKDGMDIVLTVYDLKAGTLTYSAANNGFYLIRDNQLIEYDPDKQPIGYYGDNMKPFSKQVLELKKGDCIYTFTDGYADQFGGPKGKKLKYKTMEEKLLAIHQLPMSEQKLVMDQLIEEWMGDLEQNDDICLIGVRI